MSEDRWDHHGEYAADDQDDDHKTCPTRKVRDSKPSPHARYLVIRNGLIFTATPCYGMHEPWWVAKTMEGEADPVPMMPDDEWMPIEDAILAFTTPATQEEPPKP